MKVFISYSHYDKADAQDLYTIISGCGFDPVLDEKDISGGEIIDDKVRSLLASSHILVVIISPSSIKSPWVFYEIGRADDSSKRIVPFLTHPGLKDDLPIFLQKRKYFISIDEVSKFLKGVSEWETSDIELLSVYQSGLSKAYRSRAAVPNYFSRLVAEARKEVSAMFVSGNFVSAVTFENILRKKYDIQFRLLLLNPQLVDLRNRDLSANQYKIQKSEWDTVLQMASRFANIEVRLFNIYPFWHLVLVDSAFSAVSFNPLGRIGFNYSPVYIFENNNQIGNLCEAYMDYFNIVWRDAESYQAKED